MTDIMTVFLFIATLLCFAGMVGLVAGRQDPPWSHQALVYAMFFLLVLMFVQAIEA